MTRARHYTYELAPVHTAAMTMQLSEIRGKGRPRVDTRGGHPRMHTDGKTVAAELEIASAWATDKGTNMADFDGPFELHIVLRRPLPKSAPASRIGEPDIGKPDVDNALKIFADALQGIAFKDDAQCVSCSCIKGPRTAYGQVPTAVVTIKYMGVNKEVVRGEM